MKLLNVYSMFCFDRKTMGLTFYVPILVFILTIILLSQSDHTTVYNGIIVIQGLFIPFTSWGLMYRLSEIYEVGAEETLTPYYSRLFLYDALRYITLNIICISILSGQLIFKFGLDSISPINLVHFFLLAAFFLFLGTALVVLLKNIEISLTIMFIYTLIEVVTLGEFMPWPHIFIFDPPFIDAFIITKLISIFVFTVLLLVVTLVLLQRIDRKPKNVYTRLKQFFT